MLAILMSLLGADAQNLERRDRQETIYTLRGSAEALAAFKKNVGTDWTGGAVIDADESDGALAYWAYSDRTAAEARAFMVPAIMSGLQLDFEEYKEAEQFPAERSKLDRLAVRCGAKADPFFVTPKRSVEITLPSRANSVLRVCLADGLRLDLEMPVATARQARAAK
jgi:hypothetical protein